MPTLPPPIYAEFALLLIINEPVISTLPLTSSVALGIFLPIPTLPLPSNLTFSDAAAPPPAEV